MPYPRALTEVEELDVVARYKGGHWTTQQLADRFGCGKTAIRRILHERGVDVRPAGQQPKAGQDTTKRIVAMRDGGATWFSIVDATGLSYNAVRKRYLKAKGLPLVAYKGGGVSTTAR